MDKETEVYYYLQLAHDFILFMMHLQTDGLSQEQKGRRANMIIESWHKRVETNISALHKQNIKEIAQDSKVIDSEDVLSIMANIQSIEISGLREAFKEAVRKNVLNSYKVK